jgi:opacity protein-like surface antigen
MKKTLAAATVAALVGVAGAANAADLYKGGSMKDVPAYVPPPTWTGFYIGAHVGGFWADIKDRDLDGFMGHGLGFDFNNNNNNSGVFGGGTVGYNYQAGNWGFGSGAVVIGVEADFGGAGLTNSFNDGLLATQFGFLRVKNDASFYADVTGRLGYAVGPALFYAKGGWAFLETNFTVDGCCITATRLPFSINNNNNGLDGWTAGGGIEYMWSPSWSVKAEYLFFDFSRNHDHADFIDGTRTFRFDNELQVNSFKVGLNYHFNNVYTPLK